MDLKRLIDSLGLRSLNEGAITQAMLAAFVLGYGLSEDRTWAKVLGGAGVAFVGFRYWKVRQRAAQIAQGAQQQLAARQPVDPSQRPPTADEELQPGSGPPSLRIVE